MEKIIQLTESEYARLYGNAYLNEQQIEERAQEMYEKKGAFEIRNLYNQRLEMLRNWKLKFIGWTIFGWIAALTCAIIAL